MGHSFGLLHTSGMYATAYDSNWDPMGQSGETGFCTNPNPTIGCLAPHINSYHKDYLGWFQPQQKIVLSTNATTTFNIRRQALPGFGHNYLMAVIPVNNSPTEFFTVEARTFAGYDAGVPGEAIVIHKVDTTRNDRRAQVVDATPNFDPNDDGARWVPGETYYDPASRTTITVNSSNYYGFNITVTADPCAYTLTPASQNFPASGGTATVSVTAQAGCYWTVTGNPPSVEGDEQGIITLNDATQSPWALGIADPYPSLIGIQSSNNIVSKVRVNLKKFTHARTGDVDVLLVAPNGQAVMLMSDVSDSPLDNHSFTFDPTATTQLPPTGIINSGTYLPTNYAGDEGEMDDFPSPGPEMNNYKSNLNNLRGINPNGLWSLFIVDDTPLYSGSINNGWYLQIETGWYRSDLVNGGGGNGVITIKVDPNTQGVARSGTLTIAGQTFTINQSAP